MVIDMKELRIGVVGTGFIGGRHIDAISRTTGARVVAVADPVLDKAKKTAEGIGANAYTTVDEMLEKEELDVIHNCTPTNMHYEVDVKAIEAEKHLYCEKPLALNAKEGDALLALLEKHPVANGVNLNYRMNALVQDMRSQVEEKAPGRSFLVTGSYVQDWM